MVSLNYGSTSGNYFTDEVTEDLNGRNYAFCKSHDALLTILYAAREMKFKGKEKLGLGMKKEEKNL